MNIEQYVKVMGVVILPLLLVGVLGVVLGILIRHIFFPKERRENEVLRRDFAARTAVHEKELGEMRARLEQAVSAESAAHEWEVKYNSVVAGQEGLNMALHERDARIEELKRSLATSQLRVESTNDRQSQELRAELDAKDQALREAQVMLQTLGGKVAEHERTSNDWVKQLAAKEIALREKDEEIAKLKSAPSPEPAGDQDYAIQIAARDAEIDRLRRQLLAGSSSKAVAPAPVAVPASRAGQTDLIRLNDLDENDEAKLVTAGIKSQADLIERCAGAQGRREVGAAAQLDPKAILRWVNQVDLQRIPGINEAMADLLEQVGVDTVLELGTRRADNLFRKLDEANRVTTKVPQVPSEAVVTQWVEVAKNLPRKISH